MPSSGSAASNRPPRRAARRSTIYFDADLHRALRLKAAAADTSVSEVVSDAVRRALAEDADDLAAVAERASEGDLDFEGIVRDMKRRGRL